MNNYFDLSESQKGLLYANVAMEVNTAITSDIWFDGNIDMRRAYEAVSALYDNTLVLHTVYHQNKDGYYVQDFADCPMPHSSVFTKSFSCFDDYYTVTADAK